MDNQSSDDSLCDVSTEIQQLDRKGASEEVKVKLERIQGAVQEGLYFAVYYEQDVFYIGEITKIEGKQVYMKFLEKGAGNFCYPKRDRIEKINNKYIFYGPVGLFGNDPLTVSESEIHTAYKCYKKSRA